MIGHTALRGRPVPPPPVLQSFAAQLARGVTYYREPTPDTEDDPLVYAAGIVRLRPNFYRAVVCYCAPRESGAYIFACESSRESVARWLSEHGLPTVRLVRADF